MLNSADAGAMEEWVRAAKDWGEAAQNLVGTASALAVASRSLASALDGPSTAPGVDDGTTLAYSLRLLGEEVERETATLRDRYLATAANLDQYREVLG